MEKPVFSFSLAWHPGQKPTMEHMLETAKDAVRTLGLSPYQALYLSHNDEPQPHVHVILNRVNVHTGVLAPLSHYQKPSFGMGAHIREKEQPDFLRTAGN
jgi:hypothetical protein